MSEPIADTTTSTTTVVAAVAAGGGLHLARIWALPGWQTTSVTLAGLAHGDLWPTGGRIRAAIVAAGLTWPEWPIELSVQPSSSTVADTGLDITFALAVLAASGQVPAAALTGLVCLAELRRDGRLHPIHDLPARLAVATAAGIRRVVIAEADLTAAEHPPGVAVHTARTLHQLAGALRGDPPSLPPAHPSATSPNLSNAPGPRVADLADIVAGHPGRRLLEIAAAGGHHLLTVGRGTGAGLLAERLPGLLPDLDDTDAAQVTALYRQARLLPAGMPRPPRPPWQAPHHTTRPTAWVGTADRPGAVALAHAGVLFTDAAGDLPDAAILALRSALDRHAIGTVHGGRIIQYPARIQLVLNTTGCPNPDPDGGCACPPGVHRRYLARLGPLLDRIDIQQTLPPVGAWPLESPPGESTAVVAARVAGARAIAAARWAGQPWRTNADATDEALAASFATVSTKRFVALRHHVAVGALSERAATQVRRLAWTLADLAGHHLPSTADLAEALQLRTGRPHQHPNHEEQP